MNKRDLHSCDPLGVEAGFYVPPRTLGDAPSPPPRSLRIAVLATFALMTATAGTVVYTVPVVTHTWNVVMDQTDKALSTILGRAESQTAEFVGGFSQSTAIDAQTPIAPIH